MLGQTSLLNSIIVFPTCYLMFLLRCLIDVLILMCLKLNSGSSLCSTCSFPISVDGTSSFQLLSQKPWSHPLLLSFIPHTKSVRKSCHLYFKIYPQFDHLPCYHPGPSHIISGLDYYHRLIVSFPAFTLVPFIVSTQQSEWLF